MVRGRFPVGSTFLLGLAVLVTMASSSPELDSLRSSSAKFSKDLFSVLREGKENENMVASPINLQIALAMLYAGTGGQSRTQLAKVLHVETNDQQKYLSAYKDLLESLKDPVLAIASTVFVDQSIQLLDSYAKAVSNGFAANVERVDFSASEMAAKVIDDWCAKNTNGKIKDLFKPGDLAAAKLVLASAVYFKASWKTKFNPEHTKERDFKSPSGNVKVQMMFVKETFKYAYNDQIKAQVLELPYANDKFRMLVILPSEGVALKDVESNLKTTGLDEVMKGMMSTEVEVYLPKFKIEMSHDLQGALMKLGATDIFDPPAANLTGIADANLFVGKIKQKVFIEVTEEGTEAAAVTGIQIVAYSAAIPPPAPLFVADRPFISVLYSSDLTIFESAITQPT